jgi:putative DNA primase/helicase
LTTAEFKFQQPFDFRPIATFWFGTNHLPHTRDFSDALFRRAILIEFPRVFQEHERDPNLTKKLQQELPGILNFALDGLDELFTDGRFSVPESSVELAEGWRLEADQAHQFIDECCERDKYAEVEVAELYAEYREWAKNSGISRIVQKKTFGTRLERLGFKRSRTKLARLITGVRIAVRQPLS